MALTSYRRHRFPAALIQHAVWLYGRFTLSFRDVEDRLAERGIGVSYATVRRRVLKFGGTFARSVRRCLPCPHEQWHLDEMIVMIRGKKHYSWRAVDAEGEVLDFLVQSRRNGKTRDAEAPEESGLHSCDHGHRQTQILWQGDPRSRAELRPRPEDAQEQPRRKFTSAGLPTRAQDAALQVTWLSAEVPHPSRRDIQPVQRPTPSDLSPHAPTIS